MRRVSWPSYIGELGPDEKTSHGAAALWGPVIPPLTAWCTGGRFPSLNFGFGPGRCLTEEKWAEAGHVLQVEHAFPRSCHCRGASLKRGPQSDSHRANANPGSSPELGSAEISRLQGA